jgi:hypothetical protein
MNPVHGWQRQNETNAECGGDGIEGRSLPEHDLDAEPDRTEQSRHDDGDHRLERVALRLLDALAPAATVLEIRPQLASIVISMPKEVRIDAMAFKTTASMLSCRGLCCSARVSITMARISSSRMLTV